MSELSRQSARTAAQARRLRQIKDAAHESFGPSAIESFAQVSAIFRARAASDATAHTEGQGRRSSRAPRTEGLSVRAQSGERLNSAPLSARRQSHGAAGVPAYFVGPASTNPSRRASI